MYSGIKGGTDIGSSFLGKAYPVNAGSVWTRGKLEAFCSQPIEQFPRRWLSTRRSEGMQITRTCPTSRRN